jgi:hypothetical protein
MQNSFNPSEVDILDKVVDEACRKLGRSDDATKENVASRVFFYAAQGERDFDTLLSVALNGRAGSNAA